LSDTTTCLTGEIVSIHPKREFAFLRCAELADEIFVRYGEIRKSRLANPQPGNRYTFRLSREGKRLRAVDLEAAYV
jgi:cold shock CspA family protein